MALRFRKSIKLAPGIRMNFSKSGVSWTLGPKGASIGIGGRGAYLNSGIPGTGLYSRQKISTTQSGSHQGLSRAKTEMQITVSVNDDGTIAFRDEHGNPIIEPIIELAKKQHGEMIRGLIQNKCDEINSQIEAVGKIHEYTSPPVSHKYIKNDFKEWRPTEPVQKVPGFLCRFFKSCVNRVALNNARANEQYEKNLAEWMALKSEHDNSELAIEGFYERLSNGDVEAIEQHFSSVLQDITWPNETLVSFDMPSPGILTIDVDLPEIDDMPNKTASALQRGFKLTIKEMGPTQVQKLYMAHVHAVGFRIVGEAFAASPTIKEVVISAYSQRPEKATGRINDQYLFSAKIERSVWTEIDFENLSGLDVVEAFSRFDLRRDMTRTGIFKPIEPFAISSSTVDL